MEKSRAEVGSYAIIAEPRKFLKTNLTGYNTKSLHHYSNHFHLYLSYDINVIKSYNIVLD